MPRTIYNKNKKINFLFVHFWKFLYTFLPLGSDYYNRSENGQWMASSWLQSGKMTISKAFVTVGRGTMQTQE